MSRRRHPMSVHCPNCPEEHTTLPEVCVLATLGGLLVARGFSETLVLERLATLDLAYFWDNFGPVVDWLEAHLELDAVDLDDA